MKRIDMNEWPAKLNRSDYLSLMLAVGINDIMDYLEHMTRKNGKLFTCVSCQHATGFVGDLGKCCDKPLYEVSD